MCIEPISVVVFGKAFQKIEGGGLDDQAGHWFLVMNVNTQIENEYFLPPFKNRDQCHLWATGIGKVVKTLMAKSLVVLQENEG